MEKTQEEKKPKKGGFNKIVEENSKRIEYISEIDFFIFKKTKVKFYKEAEK